MWKFRPVCELHCMVVTVKNPHPGSFDDAWRIAVPVVVCRVRRMRKMTTEALREPSGPRGGCRFCLSGRSRHPAGITKHSPDTTPPLLNYTTARTRHRFTSKNKVTPLIPLSRHRHRSPLPLHKHRSPQRLRRIQSPTMILNQRRYSCCGVFLCLPDEPFHTI